MNSERRRNVEELYHAALARAKNDRLAFLTEACDGDETLLEQVQSLLAQSHSAGGLLEGPVKAVAARMVDARESMLAGRRLGVYQVQARIGVGGMGEVYRARDTTLGRDVALKVLPPHYTSDPDRLTRFEREARVLASLNHPHIGAIYGLENADGIRALVLELVDGETLADRIARGPLSPPEALTIAAQIVEALDAAHEKGIVHRDLKPANIKVSAAGIVKVLDFGLAKAIASDGATADLTQSPTVTGGGTREGVILGTAAYMSPEQARAQSVDKRTDIWAFGCVLYEMLTGRPAFARETISDTIAAILGREPDWSLLPIATPATVARLLRRCLDKDVKRRLRDIGEARVEIEDARAPVGKRDNSDPLEARKSNRRRRIALLVSGLVLASALLFAFYSSWQERRRPDLAQPTPAVPLTALSGQVRLPALSPDGNHVAFTWTGPTNDNVDLYVQQVGAGTPLRLTTDPNNDTSPAWSPDGRAIAFLRRQPDSARHELRLIPPLGGPERKVAEVEPRNPVYRALTIAWCPDASCLIVPDAQGEDKGDALFAIGLDGEKRQVTFPAAAIIDSDPAFAPDGRWLLFRRDVTPFTSEMYRLPLAADLTAAGEPVRLTDHTVNAARPAWLPDSREIVFSARGSLWRLDALNGGAPTRLPFVGLDGYTPSISRSAADGRVRLVYVRIFSDSNIWRVDTTAAGVPSAAEPRRAISSTRADHLPALSPDGKRMAFFSGRSGEFELWVGDADGSNAVQLTSLAALPGFPRWSPDGQTLAFHSDPEGHPDALTIPANGGKPRVVMPGPLGGGYPSFSRDGRWIYFAGSDPQGRFRIWKIPPSGGTPVQITDTSGAIPIESYDGRYLFYLEAAERPSILLRQPVAGGAATKVVEGVLNGAYDVAEGGIYYMTRLSGSAEYFLDRRVGDTALRYFDFASGKSTTVADRVGTITLGLSASRDGRTIFFSRVDSSADELMLVDGFR
jgi:eukaryotic-like serine/threonine-protein kinase